MIEKPLTLDLYYFLLVLHAKKVTTTLQMRKWLAVVDLYKNPFPQQIKKHLLANVVTPTSLDSWRQFAKEDSHEEGACPATAVAASTTPVVPVDSHISVRDSISSVSWRAKELQGFESDFESTVFEANRELLNRAFRQLDILVSLLHLVESFIPARQMPSKLKLEDQNLCVWASSANDTFEQGAKIDT